jgi:hypothetical protein
MVAPTFPAPITVTFLLIKKFLPDKKYAEHASLAHKQKGTPKYIQHVQDIEMPHGLFPDLHDVNRNKIGGIF